MYVPALDAGFDDNVTKGLIRLLHGQRKSEFPRHHRSSG
jgi:hypothetical protein